MPVLDENKKQIEYIYFDRISPEYRRRTTERDNYSVSLEFQATDKLNLYVDATRSEDFQTLNRSNHDLRFNGGGSGIDLDNVVVVNNVVTELGATAS